MSKHAVLLIGFDLDVRAAVLDAAARTQREVRFARTAREAFRVLSNHCLDVEVVIVDLEPITHGLTILSALDSCREKPPVIVLTALEQCYIEPIVRWYGGVDCIGKPVSSECVARAIEKAAAKTCSCRPCSCDRWGHPREVEVKGDRFQNTLGNFAHSFRSNA